MTAMPQMVAAFNGMGGGAAAMVALGDILRLLRDNAGNVALADAIPIVLSCAIGSISFAGSIIAFAKLQELLSGRPIQYPGQQIINALVALIMLAAAVDVCIDFVPKLSFYVLLGAALLLGVLFVLPIGGADMPVVISLLNAFTGLAAAMTGFVLSNNVLIISGALVGASGTLLTILMGKAMNRSLTNVLFGAFGTLHPGGAGAAAAHGDGHVRSGTADDIGVMLAYAKEVIIVPGYGMAVAQAQHSVRELADQLEKKGVEVKYAIHPVAGRMPGHMNVLLAEANVPYPQLYDMDDINPEFPRADVALVIGANDVTNPAARQRTILADLRHADPRRRQGAKRRRAQAQHESGLRRYRQSALRESEDHDALRRRKEVDREPDLSRKRLVELRRGRRRASPSLAVSAGIQSLARPERAARAVAARLSR